MMLRAARDLALCVGATTLLLAAACVSAASAEDKPISIAFVSGPLNDSFFPPLYQGAQDAAKALGVKLNYIPIDEADIEATSARTMQTAIAQNPDAIVVGDFVTSVVDPYIKQAIAAGIPVYVNQSGQDQWQADGAFGFVGQQGPEVGKVAADRLAKAGSKTILCVINVPGNPYLQAICKGLADKAKEIRRHHGQSRIADGGFDRPGEGQSRHRRLSSIAQGRRRRLHRKRRGRHRRDGGD